MQVDKEPQAFEPILRGRAGGCCHDDYAVVSRKSAREKWITCRTTAPAHHVELSQALTAGCLPEMTFLDEATSFAFGHRPCKQCRFGDFNRFVAAWLGANGSLLTKRYTSISDIDAILWGERQTLIGASYSFACACADLPDGCLVTIDAGGDTYLVLGNRLLKWSLAGYTEGIARGGDLEVRCLTPYSLVKMFAAGYRPQIHASAADL